MIDIDNISENALQSVIKDSVHVNWDFFALKVMISRFRLKLSMIDNHKVNQREEVIQQCCTEMRELLRKSKHIPSVKKDLQIIVERYGAGV